MLLRKLYSLVLWALVGSLSGGRSWGAAHADLHRSLANKLWLKVADIAALEGDYYKAIEKLEKTAQASISNNLMKYSVKEWLLKAGICHLATKDPIAGPRALEQYAVWDPTFTSQREYKLLEELNAAVEAQDAQVFTDQLYIYDQTSRLDNWKIEILNRIKHGMEEASNEFA
jgi:alpha-soluble NSF attachment protein